MMTGGRRDKMDYQLSSYCGVIGNRDHIKIQGEKRPYWEFLDEQPGGWLTSLVYSREDVPKGKRMIWDCGAWSYKAQEIPHIGRQPVTPRWTLEQYQERAVPGDFIIAPDHMLIESFGHLDYRRQFNRASADEFWRRCEITDTGLVPMATAHGISIDERVQYAEWLHEIGYRSIALGGLAGRSSAKRSNIEIVQTVREALPDVWLHVLGLSSPDYARAWYQLGVNSFDGASHFKQAFTAGTFYTEFQGTLIKHKAARTNRETGEPIEDITAPMCDCTACSKLRDEGIDTRTYGSNENNMGRAAHNQNMLMRAHRWYMRPWWVLVSCVGEKLPRAAPAGELYQSAWFKKAKTYAGQAGDHWAILSAKCGLVIPEQVIDPYDKTLNSMPQIEREQWARWTYRHIRDTIPDEAHIIILAGKKYREHLIPLLKSYTVSVPMRGLGIGQQLRWLDDNIKTAYVQPQLF